MENETYGEHIRENDDPPVDGMGTFLWKKKGMQQPNQRV